MAIGTLSDFKIYDEQYFGGMYEGIAENLNVFNEASQGALLLSAKSVKGQFEREAFMKNLAGIISRRDPSSVAAATDQKLVQGEFVGPKINRIIGPVAGTLDEWKKIDEDPELMSFYVGKSQADGKLQDFVHSVINAVSAAIKSQAALVTTKAGGITITQNALVDMQRPFGDKAGNIVCFVMHSKQYFDLLGDAITQKIFGVANVAIYEGSVATLGKPTIVIDAPGLVAASLAPAAPGVVTITPSTSGGTIAAGTYYYKCSAVNASGESIASAEASVTNTGATSSNALSVSAVAGAVSYRWYRGTLPGGESLYFTSVGATFTDIGGASTAGTPLAITPNRYTCLGLVAGAGEIKESEDQTIFSQMITGLQNLVMRIQGEFAFNIRVKGFAYDTTQGVNPTDTTVGTPANWILQATQLKMVAGVALTTE